MNGKKLLAMMDEGATPQEILTEMEWQAEEGSRRRRNAIEIFEEGDDIPM